MTRQASVAAANFSVFQPVSPEGSEKDVGLIRVMRKFGQESFEKHPLATSGGSCFGVDCRPEVFVSKVVVLKS